MSNYMQTEITGTSYKRANMIHISNPLNSAGAAVFEEQRVYSLSDNKLIQEPSGSVGDVFDENTAATEFPLLNPKTGEATGQTASYQDLYVMLHSLYLFLAKRRDESAVAPPPAQEPAPTPSE